MTDHPTRDTDDLVLKKEPQQSRSRALVEAVLEASTRILVDEGWEAYTVQRVCEVAGVSPGSLYQYFPSKEAISYALLRRHAEEVVNQVVGALSAYADAPLDTLIDHTVEAFVVAHRPRPRLHALLGAHVARGAGPGLEDDVLNQATTLLERLIERRAQEVPGHDPHVLSFLLVYTVEGAVHSAARRQPELLRSPAFLAGLQTMARALVHTPPGR